MICIRKSLHWNHYVCDAVTCSDTEFHTRKTKVRKWFQFGTQMTGDMFRMRALQSHCLTMRVNQFTVNGFGSIGTLHGFDLFLK